MIQRRDFLLLRLAADREIELSCEQLYMRYVDAQLDGSESRLFAALAAAPRPFNSERKPA